MDGGFGICFSPFFNYSPLWLWIFLSILISILLEAAVSLTTSIVSARFVTSFAVYVIVDTATGVNYIMPVGGNGPSGITPLLDSNGNVIVDAH